MGYLYKTKHFKFSHNSDREFDQFFVWNQDSIYIMDNHRSALWCWLNEIRNKSEKIKLVHIDNHADMSPKGLHCTCAKNIKFDGLILKDYLEYRHNCQQYGSNFIFSYENFLRFFVQSYPNNINPTEVFITLNHWKHKPDTDPAIIQNLKKYLSTTKEDSDCSQLANRLYRSDLFKLFKENTHFKWIVDLDFDYFYNESTNVLNIKLAEEIFTSIKSWYDKSMIIAFTVAWSPEFLVNRKIETIEDGLEKAKDLNTLFCEIFNLDFLKK